MARAVERVLMVLMAPNAKENNKRGAGLRVSVSEARARDRPLPSETPADGYITTIFQIF